MISYHFGPYVLVRTGDDVCREKRLSSSVFNWVFYLYRSWIIYFHSVYLFWWAIYLENGIPFECITSEILGKNHLQLTKSIEKETDQVQCKQQQQQQQQNNMVDASISWFPCNWSKYPMPPLQTTHTHTYFLYLNAIILNRNYSIAERRDPQQHRTIFHQF